MSRRRRNVKGREPLIGLVILLIVLGAGFLVFHRLASDEDDSFHGLTHLDVEEYLGNSKSLQGNVYKVEGRVEDQLGWSPEGRVLVVVSQGNPVGVKVPATFSDQNIQAGQYFAFKVRVGRRGILIVEALKKA